MLKLIENYYADFGEEEKNRTNIRDSTVNEIILIVMKLFLFNLWLNSFPHQSHIQ